MSKYEAALKLLFEDSDFKVEHIRRRGEVVTQEEFEAAVDRLA